MIRGRIIDLNKLNSSEPLLQALSYQLLQRCFVSRTPKGKAMPKRSQKFKVKKKDDRSAVDTRINDNERVSIEFMYGPSLTRWIKHRLRWREAERLRLGLVGIDRKLELEVEEKKKAGMFPEEPIRLGTPGYDFVTLGVVDEEKIPKYKMVLKDGAQLAKASSGILMKQHCQRLYSDTCRRRFKKAAIDALPEHLRGPAIVADTSVYPGGRILPTLTPPIEGYREKLMAGAGRVAEKKR